MNQRFAKLIARIGRTAWTLLGVIGILPAMFSVMMFDAPESTERPATLAFAASLMTFPVVCFAAVEQISQALRVERISAAGWWALLPLANFLIGGIGYAWIVLVQNGKFNG